MSTEDMGLEDATLIAFLDGALPAKERTLLERRLAADAGLKARLEALAAGSRPFRESFEVLNGHAPTARLEATLAKSLEAVPAPVANDNDGRRSWHLPPAAIAAGLALLLVGAGIGHYTPVQWWPLGPTTQEADQETPDAWRTKVAQYWGLTTSQTLLEMPGDTAATERDLSVATKRLGFPLTPQQVALPAQEVKRVELFHYDNAPLVEIAYFDELNGPIAFCIFANNPGTVTQPELEQRKGFNVVYWSDAKRSYMVIGHGPDEIMLKIGDILAKQVAA
ncbi:anti-sigma factor family protein [Labrys okinawensis]|uniref:anti-sigma factor family protein n=1 Tax=Labrys okinawensis TaxID=346911 RepID=UPI0039BD5316